jgi:hypothetical protein
MSLHAFIPNWKAAPPRVSHSELAARQASSRPVFAAAHTAPLVAQRYEDFTFVALASMRGEPGGEEKYLALKNDWESRGKPSFPKSGNPSKIGNG